MLSKFIQAGPKSASLSDQLDEFFVLANRIQILVVFQLMQKLHILHQGHAEKPQGFFSIQQTCPTCHGTGKVVSDPCTACHGQGRTKKHKTLSVKIPAGVDQDDRIRLSGEGEAGLNGGQAGDLYVVVSLKPHPVFQRDHERYVYLTRMGWRHLPFTYEDVRQRQNYPVGELCLFSGAGYTDKTAVPIESQHPSLAQPYETTFRIFPVSRGIGALAGRQRFTRTGRSHSGPPFGACAVAGATERQS